MHRHRRNTGCPQVRRRGRRDVRAARDRRRHASGHDAAPAPSRVRPAAGSGLESPGARRGDGPGGRAASGGDRRVAGRPSRVLHRTRALGEPRPAGGPATPRRPGGVPRALLERTWSATTPPPCSSVSRPWAQPAAARPPDPARTTAGPDPQRHPLPPVAPHGLSATRRRRTSRAGPGSHGRRHRARAPAATRRGRHRRGAPAGSESRGAVVRHRRDVPVAGHHDGPPGGRVLRRRSRVGGRDASPDDARRAGHRSGPDPVRAPRRHSTRPLRHASGSPPGRVRRAHEVPPDRERRRCGRRPGSSRLGGEAAAGLAPRLPPRHVPPRVGRLLGRPPPGRHGALGP